MKLKFIKDLTGEEILAKNVVCNDGRILLRKGTKITEVYIKKLEINSIYLIYIEDDTFEDIKDNQDMQNLKLEVLQEMPSLFNNIIKGDKNKVKEQFKSIDKIIDNVIKEDCISTNLYEVKAFDDYTYIHCLDTGIMATYLAMAMGYEAKQIKEIGLAGMLHDIGKVKISNDIINKKGTLTEEESKIIKMHPIYGEEILKNNYLIPKKVREAVRDHHERVNGEGYPSNLKGNEISDYAKIVSVCDVFTAVSAKRSYRDKFSPNEAYELILSNVGTMFDEKVVNAFKKSFCIYPLGCKLLLSNGLQGYVTSQNKNFPDRPVIRVVYDLYKRTSVNVHDLDLLKNPSIVIKEIL